jgi:hypothetical protein
MCGIIPRDFDISSDLNPFITERTTISAITPTMTPAMEIKDITEIKACFRLALRYLKLKKSSNSI